MEVGVVSSVGVAIVVSGVQEVGRGAAVLSPVCLGLELLWRLTGDPDSQIYYQTGPGVSSLSPAPGYAQQLMAARDLVKRDYRHFL